MCTSKKSKLPEVKPAISPKNSNPVINFMGNTSSCINPFKPVKNKNAEFTSKKTRVKSQDDDSEDLETRSGNLFLDKEPPRLSTQFSSDWEDHFSIQRPSSFEIESSSHGDSFLTRKNDAENLDSSDSKEDIIRLCSSNNELVNAEVAEVEAERITDMEIRSEAKEKQKYTLKISEMVERIQRDESVKVNPKSSIYSGTQSKNRNKKKVGENRARNSISKLGKKKVYMNEESIHSRNSSSNNVQCRRDIDVMQVLVDLENLHGGFLRIKHMSDIVEANEVGVLLKASFVDRETGNELFHFQQWGSSTLADVSLGKALTLATEDAIRKTAHGTFASTTHQLCVYPKVRKPLIATSQTLLRPPISTR